MTLYLCHTFVSHGGYQYHPTKKWLFIYDTLETQLKKIAVGLRAVIGETELQMLIER